MIFQQFNLVGRLDVLTNVLMGRLAAVPHWRSLLNYWPTTTRRSRSRRSSSSTSRALAAQRADQLSGGQQQRVAIARALVQEPEIILADEPIASLDPRNTQIVMDALLRINKHFGITVICNLHSLDIARSYCDRLIGMAAGRVVFDGAPAKLTDAVARELYGLEAGDVLDAGPLGRAPRHDSGVRRGRRGLEQFARPLPSCVKVRYKQLQQERGRHAQSSQSSSPAQRSLAAAATAAHAQSWKATVSRAGVRQGPGRERLRHQRPLDAARQLPVQGARRQGDAAHRQRLRRRDRGPARRQHPHRDVRPGVLRPRLRDRRQGRAVRHRGQRRRHAGLLFGALREEGRALPEDRGPQGQEPLPGRPELDLRQQRAALRHAQDGHRSGALLRQGRLCRQPRERGDRASRRAPATPPSTGGTTRRSRTCCAWSARAWRRPRTSASSSSPSRS